VPGADCTPGTPGKENISLTDGNSLRAPGYTASSPANEAGEPDVPFAGTPGTSGVTPFTSCGGGAADGDADGVARFGIVSMPGTFGIPGTRGKENISSIGGNAGAVGGDAPFSPSGRYGDKPGTAGAPAGGTAARSAPLGGAVGGDEGAAIAPGSENNSGPGGSVGAIAIGETFPKAGKSCGEPGAAGEGAMPGAPGASALPKDAAMARRSVSVKGPGGDAGGDPDMLGGAPMLGAS